MTIALIWGVAFGMLSVVVTSVYWFFAIRATPNAEPEVIGYLVSQAATGALTGAIMGASFALLLAVGERRRTFEQLSTARLAAWGGVASTVAFGLSLMVLGGLGGLEGASLGQFVLPAVLLVLYGVGGATGILAIARRGRIAAGEEAGQLRAP